MAKNKQRNATKKRQERALRDTHRRREVRAKLEAKRRQGGYQPSQVPNLDQLLPEPEYVYWLAHGANYLASDYQEGNWTPLFPELYTGRLYQPEELLNKTLAHYEANGEPRKGVQKRVLAWLLTERHLIWAFKAGMAAKVLKAYPEEDPVDMLRKPHVGVLWEGFSQVFDSVEEDVHAEDAHDPDSADADRLPEPSDGDHATTPGGGDS